MKIIPNVVRHENPSFWIVHGPEHRLHVLLHPINVFGYVSMRFGFCIDQQLLADTWINKFVREQVFLSTIARHQPNLQYFINIYEFNNIIIQ